MRDILISENIAGAAVDELCARFDVLRLPELWKDAKGLMRHACDARVLFVRNQTRVTEDVLRAAQGLVAIARAGAGLDNIDVNAAKQAGVIVTYAPDQNSISVAEYTIAVMLALANRITEANADTKAGGWNRNQFVGREVYRKTLGVIGAGKIGYLTAVRAQTFGMQILACDPHLSPDNVYLAQLNAELVELDELLSRADFVSCHVPATPQTIGLMSRHRFARMKPDAFFINTSRGEIVNETDLLEALKSRKIAGAALDVRASEPPQRGELELLPNMIVTPHIAAFTREAQERVTTAVCEDIARILEGKPPKNSALPLNGAFRSSLRS